jgi:N-acetylmuramoyl-L-alanine amidase
MNTVTNTTNKKRNINYIVVHCTATPSNTTIESIKRYWKDVRKWGDVAGYHYIIKADGEVIQLLPENQNSYGVYAHNSECISLAYIGGIDKDGKPKDTRSKSQEHAMFDLIVKLTEKYKNAKVVGHRDFAGVKKACPSFDVKKWLANYTPDIETIR